MSMEIKRALRFALSGLSAIILLFIVGDKIPDPFPDPGTEISSIALKYFGDLISLFFIFLFYLVCYFFWTFVLRIKKQKVQDNNLKKSSSSKFLLWFLTIFMGIELFAFMDNYLRPNLDLFGIIGGIISILFYIPIAFGISYIIMSSLLKSLKKFKK
jgi:hypothetical protein